MGGNQVTKDMDGLFTSVIPCDVCGGREFGPGPGGRLATTGVPPMCVKCQSLERHRMIRKVWQCIPVRWLRPMDAIQFSSDLSVDPAWFASFEVSIYEKRNSLDIQAIDRPDASYDAVVCNQVIEHVEDDRRAFRELHRILRYDGFMQFSVPNPEVRFVTEEWGYPKTEQHGHYRLYGRDDLIPRFEQALPGVHILALHETDDVTGVRDFVYFSSMNPKTITRLRGYFEPFASERFVIVN